MSPPTSAQSRSVSSPNNSQAWAIIIVMMGYERSSPEGMSYEIFLPLTDAGIEILIKNVLIPRISKMCNALLLS